MNPTQQIQQLHQRRQQLLNQLATLDQIRCGSVTEQYVGGTGRDGSTRRRGPYRLYSYKEKSKTVSRRLTDPHQAATYRQQIDGFRQFQQITTELLRVGEQLSDLALNNPQALKKTTHSRSSSRSR
jgi:flagellar biosynthesis/type III secretory pathway chaperone